jgi:cobalt-zinc-cadmium efflux system membrane fusion protein
MLPSAFSRAGVCHGLAVLTSVLLLSACRPPASTPAPDAAVSQPDPALVQVGPEMAKRFQVETVLMADIVEFQSVPGRIEANDRTVTRIGAAVTGRVMEVMVDVGDRIVAGQPLASIASPELSQTQMAYLRAHSSASLAERAVERAKLLFQADVIGAAELQRRESELAVAKAESRALGDQLRLMGLSAQGLARLKEQGSLQPVGYVMASQAGIVIERKVSSGQVAQPGDPLFTVADLSNVWVVGALPEQTAKAVQVGQGVDIEVPALDGRKITGKIIYVGDTVSPETRTVTIRTQVDNSRRDMKPQMLATMRIRGEVRRQLVVSQESVIRENDHDHVYVRVDEGRYRLTQVQLDHAINDGRPVIKGLQENDQVVTHGAFHLHHERKRAEFQ